MGSPDIEKSEETNTQIDSNTNSNSKQQSVENANERPEWLPDGWDMEVRIRKSGLHMGSGYKCYIEPLKGYKFFSKPEVLRYLETVKDSSCTSKKGKKCSKTNTPNDKSCTSKEKKCSKMQTPNNKSSSSKKDKKGTSIEFPNDNSGTPKEEEKYSNMDFPNNNSSAPKKEKDGSNLDSPNENGFTSKTEKIGTNMDSPKDSSCAPKKEKNCSNMDSPIDIVVEKSIAEDLPPGWVKELKITKNRKGIRKDPFYIDPVSGYVFRSKKDVLRYLGSGDIRSCAFKPSRRQVEDEDNITPPPAAKRRKLKQDAPTQQLSAATEILDKSSLELPSANCQRKKQNGNILSRSNVASVSIGDSVLKMHSPDDGAASSSEVKKTFDPGSSALLKTESLKESAKALPASDVQEKEHAVNTMENGNKKNHSNHSISKIRKEFNVGQRSSPRLAGNKSVQLVNNVINEQTLQVPKRNLRKSRNTLDIDISVDQAAPKEQPHEQETDTIEDNKPEIQIRSNKSGKKKEHHLPRRASKRLAAIEHGSMNSKVELQQSECGPVTVLADQAPINGKSSNKRGKSEPRLEKCGKEEMDDERTEPQLSFAYHYSWSDPSLEYAINALTGVLPRADNIPSTVAETDIQKTLFDNVTERSATTIPGTDVQNTSVGNVTGRSTSAVLETDIQKASVDNATGRSPTAVPETDIQNTSVDMGGSATSVPETDLQKTLIDNVKGSSATTIPENDVQKTLVENESGRSTSTGPETDIQKSLIDSVTGSRESENNLLDTVTGSRDSEHNLLDIVTGSRDSENNLLDTVTGSRDSEHNLLDPVTGSRDSENNLHETVTGSRARKSQVRSNKPKRKKELKVPVRLSKRLAGLEPELAPAERALEYSTRKPCKEEPTATATLTNGVSDHHDAGEETKLSLLQASNSLKTEVLGESLKRSEKSYDAQTDHKEQLEKVEAENVDVRSEPQLPLPFGDSWSDPCLEFAIKTLTGAFPVDAGGDSMPALPPGFDNPPYKQVHRSVATDINQEARDNSNQSSHNKELNMVSQPELRTGSTSYENAFKFTTRDFDQGNILENLNGEPSLTGNITQPVHHSRNINTLAHEEPLKQNGQAVEGEIVTTEQQLIETGAVSHDNSELQYCAPFMNSWSDPCLEFAFKTLTGVIPLEENLTLQGCFPEPANYHERRDGVSLLPDFRSSSFSQSDFSFLHDTGVKSMPGQQSSVSSSFLPLEKTSLQGFAGVDPQPHFSQFNNNFQRR